MTQSNIIWTANDVAIATHGKVTGDWQATGLSIDSRTVQQGDLFIAIEGEHVDGHDYIQAAIEKGAVAAISNRAIDGVDETYLVIVEDTMQAMTALAQAARVRSAAKIIAVTGSVGKTGTKEMLRTACQAQGQTHASDKSYNNHFGVPYSMASMHAGIDWGIFEMGMNHANEISPLSQIVQPDIAIITTIAEVHIEHFEDGLDGIAKAKAEIFDGMKEGGIAILNRDNDQYELLKSIALKKKLRVIGFGEHDSADARMISCLEAANGTKTKANILGKDIEFFIPIAGRHIAQNALAVLTACYCAGLDLNEAINALATQEYVQGRGKREKIDSGDASNPITLIDESYNASPVAMRAAFKVLALIDPGRGGRRIAVLGDMLELGKKSGDYHADLALPLKAANVDLVYTCGKNMKKLYETLPANQRGAHKETSQELAQIVPDVLIPGDVVMVKGSLGSKMNLVVEALRSLPETIKLDTKQTKEG